MPTIHDILALGPVMPVIVIDDSQHAVPLAEALLRGGLRTIEITLRTAAAIDSIRAVAAVCPDITIGAGTVTRPDLAVAARDAGAAFAVQRGTYTLSVGGAPPGPLGVHVAEGAVAPRVNATLTVT